MTAPPTVTRESTVSHRNSETGHASDVYLLDWRKMTTEEICASMDRAKPLLRVRREHRILVIVLIDGVDAGVTLKGRVGTFLFMTKSYVGRLRVVCTDRRYRGELEAFQRITGTAFSIDDSLRESLEAITAPPRKNAAR